MLSLFALNALATDVQILAGHYTINDPANTLETTQPFFIIPDDQSYKIKVSGSSIIMKTLVRTKETSTISCESEKCEFWIIPFEYSEGKTVISDISKPFTVIVSDVTGNNPFQILITESTNEYTVTSTGDAKIKLENNKEEATEKTITSQDTIHNKIEQDYYFYIKLTVYATTGSNAVVTFKTRPYGRTEPKQYHGPLLYPNKDGVILLDMTHEYFPDYDLTYKNVYEEVYEQCDISIPGALPTMAFREFTLEKGKYLCGLNGFIIGSEQKYTAELNDNMKSEIYQYDNAIYKIAFKTTPIVFKNPVVVPRNTFNTFRIKCDSENTEDCKIQMLGFQATEGGSLLINSNATEFYAGNESVSVLSDNKVYFWSPEEKKVSFVPRKFDYQIVYAQNISTKDSSLNTQSDLVYPDWTKTGNAFEFSFKFSEPIKVKISDPAKKAASDILIPQITGVLRAKSGFKAYTADELNKNYEEKMKTIEPYEDPTDDDDKPDDDPDKKLSGGAIAGIVIGVIAGIVIIAVLVWLFVFRKPNNNGSNL